MKIALFGFPMTGKSTMFRLLTGVEPSPHATPGEAQAGVARVADPRLDRLTEMYNPKKKVPATVEYLDLAGINKGEAADALPLDQLRFAEALAHVVRAFDDESVHHAEGSVDAARDVATMETEHILADHCHRLAQMMQLERAYVVAINPDRAIGHVVETEQEFDESCLPRSCRAHKCSRGSRCEVKLDVEENRIAGAVGKADAIELDMASYI